MKEYAQKDLEAISDFLIKVSTKNYATKLEILSGASIGQHVRHILEFYLAVINGVNSGIINYDERKRELELEENREFAIHTINEIIAQVNTIEEDIKLILRANYNNKDNMLVELSTSLNREIGYCVEHSIHHQALIKIGAKILQPEQIINDKFGVAPATILYRKEAACAQ